MFFLQVPQRRRQQKATKTQDRGQSQYAYHRPTMRLDTSLDYDAGEVSMRLNGVVTYS